MKNPTIMFFLAMTFLLVISITHDASANQDSDTSRMTLDNGVWHTKVNKQIQITSDVTNGQDRTQPFAYIVQIQNQEGIVVSLSWITGTLDAGQSLNPSQSWLPTSSGVYTAQIFVWAGINNPDALSSPLSMQIQVT